MALDGRLRFEFDWLPADGIRSPELAATWSRLELWVDKDCVSQVEEMQSGSVRRSIFVPLYPLAEWIAYNWWLLKADSRPGLLPAWALAPNGEVPSPLIHQTNVQRHNVRDAGDGFLWPNLSFVPEGAATRLVWRRYSPSASAQIRFIQQGERFVDPAALEETLAAFVDAVVTRLEEESISDTPLATEWSALKELTPDEADFCLAAARLGIDPFSANGDVAGRLERAAAMLEDQILDEFLAAVELEEFDDGLPWVTETISDFARRSGSDNSTLTQLVSMLEADQWSASDALPWELGYAQARVVRSRIGLSETERIALDDFIAAESRPFGGRTLHAVGAWLRGGSHVLGLARLGNENAKRFAQSRALWHCAFETARVNYLLTVAHTYSQRIDRAFAAELLAPAAGIAARLPSATVTQQDVASVARHFGASEFVVRHQIENQLLLATHE